MAFKVGGRSIPVINNNTDVNINYRDSTNNVRLEDGKIILDLSKGDLFRLPDLGGNNEREYDVANGGYYNQGTYDSDNEFNRKGIASAIPLAGVFNGADLPPITFENYPPAGEVRKVSLLAHYNPIRSSVSQLETVKPILDFSTIIEPTENAHGFHMSSNGKHIVNTTYLGASDERKSLIYYRKLEKSYSLAGHNAGANWNHREFPAETGDPGFYTFGFFPKLWDSADSAGADPANVDLFYNGDGSALYYVNGNTDEFAKYPLSKRFSINSLDRTNRTDIDFSVWTSNTSPYLTGGKWHANGKYLFCIDYAMTGSGSNAYGVQRFTVSTPYDLETIVDGKWKQLGNITGSIVQYPYEIEPNGERLYMGVSDTEYVMYTFTSGKPFDVDNLGGGGSTRDWHSNETFPLNLSKIRNLQFVGPKKDMLLMSDEYTYSSSQYTRLYLLGNNSFPQLGGYQGNSTDYDVSMADHWVFDDKISVDSSHMWGAQNKQQFGGRTSYTDSTAALSGKIYTHLIESNGSGEVYNYEYFKDGSLTAQYPAPDWINGNPKNKIRYVRPFGIDYFEFLVMDSDKGAILTNHVSGRRNDYSAFPTSGEMLYTIPGIYNFTVPEGVTYLTAIATAGGQGGDTGSQTIRSNNGDAIDGRGGDGGDGGMTSYQRFTVSGGQSLIFVVGAGGAAPVETDSALGASSGATGFNTYITTGLFFGTTKVRANGGGLSTSGAVGTRNAGARGGFDTVYSETLSSPADSAVTVVMGLAGGGGGAGGYGYDLSTTLGQGGDGSNSAPGDDGNGFGNQGGRGGGGGGGCPDIYKMQTESPKEFVPKTAGSGGGVYPYGPVWKPEMPIPANTRVQVNGGAGDGAFSSTGSSGYDATDGGTGSRGLGGRTPWNAGAGGAGNTFRPFRPSGGTYDRQDSRLYGGDAGGDGQLRIFWGNEHQAPYYRDLSEAQSTTGTLESQTYPSAFHARVGHEGSHIIILNPKELNHWG